VTLAVALASAWPAWRWWSSALAYAPAGDTLVTRLDLVVLKELVQFDRSSAFGMAGAGLMAGLVLAVLLNPLLAGGTIALLADIGGGRYGSRFVGEGVRLYGRFLRALVYLGLPGVVLLQLVAAGFDPIVKAVSARGYELGASAMIALQVVVLAAVAAFVTAAIDLARIHLAIGDSRRVLAVSLQSIPFALRHLGALVRVGLAYAVLLLALALVVVFLRSLLPGGWGWLVLAVGLQQALSYARLRLRVATLASGLALVRARWPVPSAAPAAVPAELDAGLAYPVDPRAGDDPADVPPLELPAATAHD
jgi:hypothetical protein